MLPEGCGFSCRTRGCRARPPSQPSCRRAGRGWKHTHTHTHCLSLSPFKAPVPKQPGPPPIPHPFLPSLTGPQELGVDAAPRLETLAVEEPAKRKGGVVLSSPAELVDRLRNEAKVI